MSFPSLNSSVGLRPSSSHRRHPPCVRLARGSRPCCQSTRARLPAKAIKPCQAASSDMIFPSNGQSVNQQAAEQTAPSPTSSAPLDPKMVAEWLRQYLPFSVLGPDALSELAEMMEVQKASAGKLLQGVGLEAKYLYVVHKGTVAVTNTSLQGSPKAEAGPGTLLNLSELLLSEPCLTRISAVTSCTLWVIPKEKFQAWAQRRSDLVLEIGLMMNRDMSRRLQQMSAEIAEEERRQRALQPFLVPAPKWGIIGNSKYAERLRRAIVMAARDPKGAPVMVFGEPGLEKDNIAALIHFGGSRRVKPMLQIDCSTMDSQLSDLFGRGNREGLLHWARDGTVLLNNVHQAPPQALGPLRQLIFNRRYQPAPGLLATGSLDLPPPERECQARIIVTAEQDVPALKGITIIKVPPLRLRPSDILDYYRFKTRLLSREFGERLALTPEAERQLLSYSFPGNIQELFSMVKRAVVQTSNPAEVPGKRAAATAAAASARELKRSSSGTITLDKDVFWFAAQPKDRFRWNLLNAYPLLRTFFAGDFFPEILNHRYIKYIFAVVVAILFIGPQDRQHNFCLNVFWDYWWPGIFIVYPFLGRIWCAVCPFMIYGEVVQRWRTATGAKLLKWPKEQMERWGGWFLFGLFAGILVWEEVWDLPNTAYLSSWLLLIITGGAMVCSYFFERRLWCRYLCPIGGMNGLFAKLSMTELRARHGVCSGTCSTYHCYKGGPAEPPEGQETLGCPIYSHPAQLTDNRNCVLCMTCLKACPHRSIEVRLRPPGVDLWSGHQASWHEVALLYMLMGAVYLHRLPELEDQFGISHAIFTDKLPHIIGSAAIMAVPGLLCWAADAAMRTFHDQLKMPPAAPLAYSPAVRPGDAGLSPAAATAAAEERSLEAMPPAFLQMSYAYLPLVWGATLAHYTQALLEEAGTILPVTAGTFGMDGGGLPVLVADHAVTGFVQGSLLLGSAGLSLLLARKLSNRKWSVLAPQCLAVLGLTAELWYLVVR